MQITLKPIGYVQSSRTEIEDDNWGEVLSEIVLTDKFEADALLGIENFSHAEIIFYFDRVKDEKIVSGARGSDLDPSTAGDDGFTSKWGVDATAKPLLKDFTPRHRFDQAVWDRIDVKKILSQ